MEDLTYTSESQRQYDYMAQMKQWVSKQSEKMGRPLTCHITTFGCQMVSQITSNKLDNYC